ncbi:type IX secretion system plug protein [Deminuibacter soli]|uniref:DUF5103 domain-containing protein n=1 Tax=Deminuibacter soli TaxID=2291815 RepID=A0A3E1NM20_9BACT|nr:DUF5103 domain-containing protein [Deminuibacter soli]RFM28973.1 DUF5103 domain-containing protein [Deminuibacter soli]
MRYLFACLLLLPHSLLHAQQPDKIYMPNINGVKLFLNGSQASYPVITLGSTYSLELHFDDLDAYVKNYSYTFQLCNADWTPVDLSPFDYLQGFTQNRITQYTASSIATTRYIHYQVSLPERNCIPNKSGNYLVKVFLNGDTSQLAFCSRMLVADNRVDIAAQIQLPFDFNLQRTSHKIQFSLNKSKLNILNPDQLKVVVLQNYRWDNAITGKQPVFMRNDDYEYNGERDFIFPAGKEYRWIDLRSFRFQSERIADINMRATPFDVYMKPDGERTQVRYLYYQDLNGFYQIGSTEQINGWTQGDYGNVHFVFVPLNHQPIPGKDIYITGQFNGYVLNDSAKLAYNAEKGIYEKTMLLKQGYYSYAYATMGNAISPTAPDFSLTEGNYYETENNYTILVYYRSLSNRYDELVGITTVNSRLNRTF